MSHDIVVIIVQVVSVGLTYYFGRRSVMSDFKTKALKTRYETAYVPYVKLLYHAQLTEEIRADISLQTRGELLKLISQNLEHWEDTTLRLYPALYSAFLNLLEYEDGNEEYGNAPSEFYKAVNTITESILADTQSIARELYLPPLGAALYENYRRNGQTPPEPQA
jgi:hypothetical protein